MTSMNPFNINFGKVPNSFISRTSDLQEVYDSFSSDDPFSNVYILTGIRGSGKSVAMSTIVDYYKSLKNWICVELNPESDMLEQLASKLLDEGKLKKIFLKSEFNYSFNGIGIKIEGNIPVSNISSLLKREFEYLSKKNIKVLVSVDEVVSNNHMKVFAHEFQTLLREDFFVCLLMTGLYKNISTLENQKSLTFLYRAPKIYLKELNVKSITNSYMNIFEIIEKDAVDLAKLTKGYAFAYQLLGNLLYESKKKSVDDKILQRYDELLHERAYDVIFNELTNNEKMILKSSSIDNSNTYIINHTGLTKSQLSQYKKELSQNGIIIPDRNSVIYRLPRFKEYLDFIRYYDE